MPRQRRQQLPRLRVVIARLAAPVWMRKRVQPVYASAHQVLVVRHQLFRHVVDAAHRRDDPDFIPHRRTAVLPPVALECLRLRRLYLGYRRLIGVLLLAGQVGPHVVRMHPTARLHRLRRMADREAVFHHRFPCRDRYERDLMPLRDILPRGHHRVSRFQRFSLRRSMQRHRHVVPLCDPYQLCHLILPLTGRRRTRPPRPPRGSS